MSDYQQVVIRGQQSEVGIIKAGVPQGSVLQRPLLFLIYINDLTNLTQCNIKLFVDDTSLFIEFDNPDVAAEALNKDLVNIQGWADQWLIKFSPAKTKLVTCSFKKKQATTFRFNNIELESINNHKHLGLFLSQDLSWSNHINSILQSVSSMVDVLKKFNMIWTGNLRKLSTLALLYQKWNMVVIFGRTVVDVTLICFTFCN